MIILSKDTSQSTLVKVWYYVPLASAPFVITAGNFAMSSISTTKGISPLFVPIWANLATVVVLGLVSIFTTSEVPSSYKFWVLALVAAPAINLMAWQFKMLAFANDKPTKIAPITFLESVFCLILDFFWFNVSLNAWQLSGMALLFGVFCGRLICARVQK
jgi:drug/metabolite transporter (DMT)-like permease